MSGLDATLALKQAWYNLREVAKLKGVPYGTLTARPWLKPNGGVPDGIVGGRDRWKREKVIRWLTEADSDLPCISETRMKKGGG